MLGISMAMRYWPLRAAASTSLSSRAPWSRPMTILVSMRLMMPRAELPRVMGIPMTRTCRRIAPPEEGTSRDFTRFRWVSR